MGISIRVELMMTIGVVIGRMVVVEVIPGMMYSWMKTKATTV